MFQNVKLFFERIQYNSLYTKPSLGVITFPLQCCAGGKRALARRRNGTAFIYGMMLFADICK